MIHLTPAGVESIETYDAVVRPAWETYGAVERPAREALTASGDPLIAWIASNVESHYLDYAIDMLRTALDAPIDGDAYAKDKGWCETWEDLRAAAIEAGVVSEAAEVTA
jgi:hypothetical protein